MLTKSHEILHQYYLVLRFTLRCILICIWKLAYDCAPAVQVTQNSTILLYTLCPNKNAHLLIFWNISVINQPFFSNIRCTHMVNTLTISAILLV